MSDLIRFLFLLANGLTFAGLLFVIASGFSLMFGLMRVVNLAHGAFYILGAYLAWTVQSQGGDWVVGLFVAAVGVGLLALLTFFLVRRVQGDLPQTLLTLGLGIGVADLSLWIWGGLPKTMRAPEILTTRIAIGGFTYPGYRYFVLITAVVVGFGLWYMLQRTRLGKIIRAGVDNREMVSAIGINIDSLFVKVFLLGGVITGFAGAIGGSYLAFGPGADFEILTFALVVVIIGGMGSIAGSAVGAIVVGLVDSFGRTYASELSIFLLGLTVIVVILIRPQGLFGRVQE